MELVSIIIPTLNEEKNISKIIKDLQNQTYRNLEIIVVDGKSTDKTYQLLSKINNVKRLQTNPNNALQRNLAVAKAKGKFIYFFDADIVIKKDFIEKSLNQFKKRNLDIACPLYFPLTYKLHFKLQNNFPITFYKNRFTITNNKEMFFVELQVNLQMFN